MALDVLPKVKPPLGYPDVEEIVPAGFTGTKQKGMEATYLKLKDGMPCTTASPSSLEAAANRMVRKTKAV